MNRYPRDFQGYGRQPPDPCWPGGARIAVQFVVNYEEGGENCVLHGDEGSEAFLSEIVGAQPWPGQRHWNMESIYEYGARAGFWRLRRLFDEFSVPVTVYAVATALERSPVQTRAMIDSGWEIASHGLKWIEYKDFDRGRERKHMVEAVRRHEAAVGEAPRGWYTGRCSINTLELAAQTGLFDYLADSYADDLPYWLRLSGRDQLIVPYTLDANDMRFATPQGFNAGTQFLDYLRDSFDILYAEGEAGYPKMLSVGLHCRLAGRPGRTMALRRFLEHIQSHSAVWMAKRIDIARHWARVHPPDRRSRPSGMGRQEFLERYGNIFEHSPWVAERAFDLELGPAHDTVEGLHSAFVRAFRSASEVERLAVARAHPELAVSPSRKGLLTTESQGEQSRARLEALPSLDQARFDALNARYSARFGFPFILAVGDHDRDSILQNFERRIGQEHSQELEEAFRQIERIALLRLRKLFDQESVHND